VIRIPDLPEDWLLALSPFDGPDAWRGLKPQVEASYGSGEVHPPAHQLWTALELCPFESVRIVVLGQDPYHRPGQAHGLAFSVPTGVQPPPSLRSIFNELRSDTGLEPPKSGDLSGWAQQGILLLNTALTVRNGEPGSHADGRWNGLVDSILQALNAEERPIAFWLWGAQAQKRAAFLSNPGHLVLAASHPSPLGAYRGFFGSKPFSKTELWFKSQGLSAPDWSASQPTFEQ